MTNRQNFLVLTLCLLLFAGISLYSAPPLSNAKVTLRCSNGKTFTATTSSSGSFTITKDEDCDDFTISIENDGSSFTNAKWSFGQSNSGPRDLSSGMSTGRSAVHPIKIKVPLCPDGRCSESNATCTLDLNVTGNQIQGMAINEKGLPGEKPVKKGTKSGNK